MRLGNVASRLVGAEARTDGAGAVLFAQLSGVDVEAVVAAFAGAQGVDEHFGVVEPGRLRRSKHAREADIGRTRQVRGESGDGVRLHVVQEEVRAWRGARVAAEQDALAVGCPGPDANASALRT